MVLGKMKPGKSIISPQNVCLNLVTIFLSVVRRLLRFLARGGAVAPVQESYVTAIMSPEGGWIGASQTSRNSK